MAALCEQWMVHVEWRVCRHHVCFGSTSVPQVGSYQRKKKKKGTHIDVSARGLVFKQERDYVFGLEDRRDNDVDICGCGVADLESGQLDSLQSQLSNEEAMAPDSRHVK